MYSNVVLNLFNNPKNAGRISKPDGIADCFNFDTTAHVEFSLRIENGIISDCKFRAQANPYIVAICSTITTTVKNKMVSMIFLDPYSIKQELGEDSKIDISFCIDCLKMAIDDYKEKLQKQNKTNKESEINVEQNQEDMIDDLEGEIDDKIVETPEVENKESNISMPNIFNLNLNLNLNREKEEKTDVKSKNNDDDDDDFDFSDFFDDIDI